MVVEDEERAVMITCDMDHGLRHQPTSQLGFNFPIADSGKLYFTRQFNPPDPTLDKNYGSSLNIEDIINISVSETLT